MTKNFLFRLGELHLLFEMLKVLGKYIVNNSELEICGPANIELMRNSKYMKRYFDVNTTLYVPYMFLLHV